MSNKLSLVGMLLGPLESILKRVIPDKGERERMAHEIAVMVETQTHSQIMGQIEINKEQAKHASVFVAGPRPFLMWVCGFSFAWAFFAYPIGQWIAFLFGKDLTGAPELDLATMMPVLLGLLGLGGMRSYEKRHGVARSRLSEATKLPSGD